MKKRRGETFGQEKSPKLGLWFIKIEYTKSQPSFSNQNLKLVEQMLKKVEQSSFIIPSRAVIPLHDLAPQSYWNHEITAKNWNKNSPSSSITHAGSSILAVIANIEHYRQSILMTNEVKTIVEMFNGMALERQGRKMKRVTHLTTHVFQ